MRAERTWAAKGVQGAGEGHVAEPQAGRARKEAGESAGTRGRPSHRGCKLWASGVRQPRTGPGPFAGRGGADGRFLGVSYERLERTHTRARSDVPASARGPGGLALSPFRVHVWEPALGSGPSAHASECGPWEAGGRGCRTGDFNSIWEVAVFSVNASVPPSATPI